MDDDRARLIKFSADFKDRYDQHKLVVDERAWKYICPLSNLVNEWKRNDWWSTLPESGLPLDEQISELDEQYGTIKRHPPLLKHYFLNISSGFNAPGSYGNITQEFNEARSPFLECSSHVEINLPTGWFIEFEEQGIDVRIFPLFQKLMSVAIGFERAIEFELRRYGRIYGFPGTSRIDIDRCVHEMKVAVKAAKTIQRRFRLWVWRKATVWNPNTHTGALNLLIHARVTTRRSL